MGEKPRTWVCLVWPVQGPPRRKKGTAHSTAAVGSGDAGSRWAAKSRFRRSLRVSRPITGSVILAALTSGRGSSRGSRFSAGWSSIPDREQTMQQKTDPGRISPRCGQTDWGVNGPIGKRGTNRGSWGACPGTSLKSRVCNPSRIRKQPLRDDTSRARARAAPCCIRRQLKPSRAAIDRVLVPRLMSSSQAYSRASIDSETTDARTDEFSVSRLHFDT